MEADLENGGSAVVHDLSPGRLELAGLQANVATTNGSVARSEVPVVKDYKSSSTSSEVPTAPFVKRVTTAPVDNRALPTVKRAQAPRTKLVDFDDLPNRNVSRRDASPGILKTNDLLQRNQALPKFPVLEAACSRPKDDSIFLLLQTWWRIVWRNLIWNPLNSTAIPQNIRDSWEHSKLQ